MKMRSLYRLVAFLLVWAIIGWGVWLAVSAATPYVQKLLDDYLVFGRLDQPLAAAAFCLWVVLTLLVGFTPFLAAGFSGPAILWAHEHLNPPRRIRQRR